MRLKFNIQDILFFHLDHLRLNDRTYRSKIDYHAVCNSILIDENFRLVAVVAFLNCFASKMCNKHEKNKMKTKRKTLIIHKNFRLLFTTLPERLPANFIIAHLCVCVCVLM